MTENAQILTNVRRQKSQTQHDIAALLKMPRTTYAYKEETGTFTEEEKAKIARHLKVDMNYIVWKPTSTGKISDDRDLKIRQQAETIIKLEAEVKLLKEMYHNLLQERRS